MQQVSRVGTRAAAVGTPPRYMGHPLYRVSYRGTPVYSLALKKLNHCQIIANWLMRYAFRLFCSRRFCNTVKNYNFSFSTELTYQQQVHQPDSLRHSRPSQYDKMNSRWFEIFTDLIYFWFLNVQLGQIPQLPMVSGMSKSTARRFWSRQPHNTNG